ncbi:hypothetical protein FZC66_01855 [Priestia megaterium]|nr:hypothetical protein FZC66_01855 [Priestia megaterium]
MNVIEALIEFIVGNLFIIVIIGGVIFNVIQRFMATSNEDEQKRSKRQPMPPVGGPSTSDRPKRIPYRPEMERKEEPVRQLTHKVESVEPTNAQQQLQEKLEELKSKAKQSPSPISKGSISSMSKSRATTSSLHVSRKEALQGVIWSEILGAPKSKRQIYKR